MGERRKISQDIWTPPDQSRRPAPRPHLRGVCRALARTPRVEATDPSALPDAALGSPADPSRLRGRPGHRHHQRSRPRLARRPRPPEAHPQGARLRTLRSILATAVEDEKTGANPAHIRGAGTTAEPARSSPQPCPSWRRSPRRCLSVTDRWSCLVVVCLAVRRVDRVSPANLIQERRDPRPPGGGAPTAPVAVGPRSRMPACVTWPFPRTSFRCSRHIAISCRCAALIRSCSRLLMGCRTSRRARSTGSTTPPGSQRAGPTCAGTTCGDTAVLATADGRDAGRVDVPARALDLLKRLCATSTQPRGGTRRSPQL